MFTPNVRLPWIACCVLPRVFRHTRSIGGSSDSDETALAVAPKSSSPSRVVSTVTPLAKWPMTCRKVSLSVMSRVLSESASRPDRPGRAIAAGSARALP